MKFSAKASMPAFYDGPPPRCLPIVTGLWFAWYAFHPETAVFVAGD